MKYNGLEKMTLIHNQFINNSDQTYHMLRDTHTIYMEAYDWSLCIEGTLHFNINLGSKVNLNPLE